MEIIIKNKEFDNDNDDTYVIMELDGIKIKGNRLNEEYFNTRPRKNTFKYYKKRRNISSVWEMWRN